MTKEERIDRIWQLEVRHDRMKAILNSICECHKSVHRKGEKVNMFLSGETGLGKTTICSNYLSDFPRGMDKNGAIIPVLYTRTPTSPTPKGLTTKMLNDLSCPAAHKGVFIKQQIRLKELISACKVQMVIIDELQHLIDPDSYQILKDVSNLIKVLIDDLQVPIIMVGLPESVAVLTSNRQLGRRVSQREELSEFRWDDPDQRKQFRSLLKTLDGRLPLNNSSALATMDMSKRIHYASDGVMDHFMKLIRHSAQFAVEKDMDCIDMPILDQMYDQHISSLFPKKFNPFADRNLNRQLTVSRKKRKATGQKAVSNRVKPRHKKDTVGNILKA